MSVRCPSCDEYSSLPPTIEADFSTPWCDFCTAPLHGYSKQYRRCERCGSLTLDAFSACEACGRPFGSRANVLREAVPVAGLLAAGRWHSYDPRPDATDIDAPYTVVTDIAALVSALPEISAANALAIDTETTGLDPFSSRLLLLQIATPTRVFVIDLTAIDRQDAGRLLKPILEKTDPIKILHNAGFDYKFIRLQLGIQLHGIFDTMLAHSVLSAGTLIQAALQSVAKLYLGIALRERYSDDIRARRTAYC